MITIVANALGYEIAVGEAAVGSRRLFEDTAMGELDEFAATYNDLVTHQPDRPDKFLELGDVLRSWLDRSDQAFTTAFQMTNERHIEFRVSENPSKVEASFAAAPWELLTIDGAVLAAHDTWRVAFSRRLGTPDSSSPPLDDYRLGLTFMASSPRGQNELDFEREEAAILEAVGDRNVDLVVEESGDLDQLLRSLSEPTHAVHLTCHGINNWRQGAGSPPTPILLTENEFGGARPSTPGDLAAALHKRCRFAFVSACLTSTPPPQPAADAPTDPGTTADLSHSMASALIVAGIPAALGWAGSVTDGAATDFAARLYRRLSDRADLPTAVADARRPMIYSENESERRDWHLARLWLGPSGGAAIVGGKKKRSFVSANNAERAFLDRGHSVPVAGAAAFVGRRRESQTSLQVLSNDEHIGLMLQGMGRLGKSSLAARIAGRLDFDLAVVHGAYDELGLVDSIAPEVAQIPAARQMLDARRAEIRADPTALYGLLVDLLSGPCAQHDGNQRPLLLVVDDLEQILQAGGDGEPHTVQPAFAQVMRQVLRAFRDASTNSRLLVTTRFTFALDGLEETLFHLPLGPFTEVAQRKMALRQRQLAALSELSEIESREALVPQIIEATVGNPGLQDLVGSRMLYSPEVPPEAVDGLLQQMRSWLAGSDLLPDDPKLSGFLEELAVDSLVSQAAASSQYLLTALRTFGPPIPQPVAQTVAETVGGSLTELIGLGILDVFEDLFDPRIRALTPTRLVAGRIEAPDAQLRQKAATAALAELFDAWGGEHQHDSRPDVLDVELTTLACTAFGTP